MGSYRDRITADVKAAMKAGDKARVQTLRSLLAAIKSAQDDRGEPELPDDAELALLQKACKTRRDAIAQARDAGRQDVVDSEEAEFAVIEGYLPEMLTGDALRTKVREVAAEVGYRGPKDTGTFMKTWMARYRGQADGREVQEALKEL